jgi:hypothetical protein
MRTFVCLLMLGCCSASSAFGRDSATSAVAKTEKKSATFVAPQNSVTWGPLRPDRSGSRNPGAAPAGLPIPRRRRLTTKSTSEHSWGRCPGVLRSCIIELNTTSKVEASGPSLRAACGHRHASS